MFSRSFTLPLVLALACSSMSANAVTVESTLLSLGGNSYQFNYTITNDDIVSGFDEFSIYFDNTSYDNLAVVASHADWDSAIIPAELFLPLNHPDVFDSIALVQPLGLGETISGFSVSFDWIGVGLPGVQNFDVIDAGSYTILQSGTTTLAAPEVPVPASLPLLASALTGLAIVRQRKKVRA
jgi:hypothetical protein